MSEGDVCIGCKKVLGEEDYITTYEDRGEFWGCPCSEEIVIGYKCSKCGAEGDF